MLLLLLFVRYLHQASILTHPLFLLGHHAVGGGGERRRAAKAAAAACGGGVRLFSVTSDGTLRGEMKRMSKICPDTNLQNVGAHILGLKIGLKRHKFVSL